MKYRQLQHLRSGEWHHRARLSRRGGPEHRSTGGHGIPGLGRGLFDEHPELFSKLPDEDGERRDRQICVSNPLALELAVEEVRERLEPGPEKKYIGMASFDGGNYCQCLECQELDQGVYDPTGDRISMTDRYVWLFNRILEELEDDYPNLHITHYTYGAHMMPPAIEMNERIVPIFAPITLDRIRGMDNPMSPDYA